MTRKNAILIGGLSTCTTVMALSAMPATASADDAAGRFIIEVDKPSLVQATAQSLPEDIKRVEAIRGKTFNGLVVEAPKAGAQALRELPGVTNVEEDQRVSVDSQVNSWGIDRIDQRNLPLNGSYSNASDGSGTHIFVIDTGVTENTILSGRVGNGYDQVDGDTSAQDCHGHGTHVAGTAAGAGGYGVAPGATIHPVRVLDCDGSGWLSDVIAGINWVAANAPEASVANTSLGGGRSEALNTAVDQLFASGTPLATAAGNSWDDACDYSPASAETAITTAASDEDDSLAYFSNDGRCVDLAAPGVEITSMLPDGTVEAWDGTSMASPHVAGAMATFLASKPKSSSTEVVDWVKASATKAKVDGYDLLFASTDAPDLTAPAPVTGLTAIANASSTTLSWTNPSDPDLESVIVRRVVGIVPPAFPQDGEPVSLVEPTAKTATDSGLAPDTLYSYAVFTRDKAGNTNQSGATVTIRTAKVLPPQPGQPKASVVKVGAHKAKLRWTALSDAWSYAVASRKSGAKKWVDQGATEGTTFKVKNLKAKKQYTIRVIASNAAGPGVPGFVRLKTVK